MGLDDVEIVLELEDFFGIKIPDEDAAQVITVSQLQSLCARLVRERDGLALLDEEHEISVYEEVRVIIAEQMGIPLHRVTPQAELARDLGVGR